MAENQQQGAVPEGLDVRKIDVQLLIQDLAQKSREVYEERRMGEKRVAEERERSRFEVERTRSELSSRVEAQSKENEALIRALGRVQAENDRLREENAVLRLTKSNGHKPSEPAETRTDPKPSVTDRLSGTPPSMRDMTVPLVGIQPAPALGKPVSVHPAVDPLTQF